MADHLAVAFVSRLASATLLALALILCACAPLPPREAPPEPPAPSEASEPGQAEPQTAQTGEPESDSRPEAEPAEPDESSRPVVSEVVDEPDPEAVQQDPAPDKAASEPAPETPVADRDIAISGRITLSGGDADPKEAVVYFVPVDAAGLVQKSDRSETYDIVTRDKSLSPTVLAVSRGTEVRFPNQDPILHNLFSVSAENGFDLGVYGPEEAPAVTFEHPGVVNVYCNVHHDMHAHVLVVDTPFRTRPDSDGTFRLAGLPAGRGELHVWHRQSNRWSRRLELPANGAFEVSLEVTKPRLPPHRDKVGQSYNRRDRDPYR